MCVCTLCMNITVRMKCVWVSLSQHHLSLFSLTWKFLVLFSRLFISLQWSYCSMHCSERNCILQTSTYQPFDDDSGGPYNGYYLLKRSKKMIKKVNRVFHKYYERFHLHSKWPQMWATQTIMGIANIHWIWNQFFFIWSLPNVSPMLKWHVHCVYDTLYTWCCMLFSSLKCKKQWNVLESSPDWSWSLLPLLLFCIL